MLLLDFSTVAFSLAGIIGFSSSLPPGVVCALVGGGVVVFGLVGGAKVGRSFMLRFFHSSCFVLFIIIPEGLFTWSKFERLVKIKICFILLKPILFFFVWLGFFVLFVSLEKWFDWLIICYIRTILPSFFKMKIHYGKPNLI